MSVEKNLRRCKICNEFKERIEDGKSPNGKDKKWRDTTGRLWNGNCCPSCNVSRAKETMRITRGKDEA